MDPLEFISQEIPISHVASSTGIPVNSVVVTNSSIATNSSQMAISRIAKRVVAVLSKQTMTQSTNTLGDYFSHLLSPYALSCIAMAIVLNRTGNFAAVRRPTPLPVIYRLALRLVAISSLLYSMCPLVTAFKCTLAHDSWLFRVIPLYFDPVDWNECPRPSVMWPFHQAICVGHFIETFSSVIQGQIPHSEAGMTLFEYSVAFQETQYASHLSQEVAVVSLTCALLQLSLHIMAGFNLTKYRLIPSAILGVSFLLYFAYSLIFLGHWASFPTVCIIGYLPQLGVAITVIICALLYGIAGLSAGFDNLRVSPNGLSLSLADDYYTCLTKLAVKAFTSVSDTTFLREDEALATPLTTWVEKISSEDSIPHGYANEVSNPEPYVRSSDSDSHGHVGFVTPLSRILSLCVLIYQMIRLAIRSVRKYMSNLLKFEQTPCVVVEEHSAQNFTDAPFGHDESTCWSVVHSQLSTDSSKVYSALLMGGALPDTDSSADYDDDFLDENTEIDEDTDEEVEAEEGDAFNLGNFNENGASLLATALSDSYFSETSLLNLINSDYIHILASHLSSADRIVTRSVYTKEHRNEAEELVKLIIQKRPQQVADLNDQELASMCVVCHAMPREVILWPCKCFSLCDKCRVSLAVYNFHQCVCCRQRVEGFSKVYVP